jgi:hypothetical protein
MHWYETEQCSFRISTGKCMSTKTIALLAHTLRRLKFVHTEFKNTISNSQKLHCICTAMKILLTVFSEMVIVYCKSHVKKV